MNVWNENALENIDYSGFDLVITNPPYNEEKKQGLTNSKAIYESFINKFLEAKYQCILSPSKFYRQT